MHVCMHAWMHAYIHTYIHHFHTLDQRDLPMYISYINLWSGIYHRDISRYIPDHKLFDAKAAIYIACTNSPSIVGFNY